VEREVVGQGLGKQVNVAHLAGSVSSGFGFSAAVLRRRLGGPPLAVLEPSQLPFPDGLRRLEKNIASLEINPLKLRHLNKLK
jgi:hypothetical protein